MEVVLFMLGSLAFLGGLLFCLVRVFAPGEREEAAAAPPVPQPVAEGLTFRVVNVRGVCPAGIRPGDLITLNAAGSTIPPLCAPAEAVLRLAATAGNGYQADGWCCPIFEHQLSFQREPTAKAA